MILNAGCGGKTNDRACFLGDVRIDIKHFPPVTSLMDAHFLGFKDSVFDKIVCFEVLEHLNSPIKALGELRRVLKENGEITISVPNVWYWRRIVRTLIKQHKVLEKIPTSDHKQAWDVIEFHNLAYQAGLKITDVKWLDWYPKGKLKLEFLDWIFKFFPQVCFTHVMFKLKP